MTCNRRSRPTIPAALALVTLLALACGGKGQGQVTPETGTGTPGSAAFPVILEHDTRVIASADGSEIGEEPVPYQPRSAAAEGAPSPDGSLVATFRDGTLFVQEGDAAPEVIAEVPSTEEFASIVWSPDGSRLVFDVSFEGGSASLYVVGVDGAGLVDIGQGLQGDGLAFHTAWSPDSQRVAFGVRSSPQNPDGAHVMYVAQVNGSETTPLGAYSGYHGWEGGSDLPAWSPDGTRIGVFSPEGAMRVLDASGGPAVDIPGSQRVYRFSWSPDSRFLAFDDGAQDSVIKIADIAQAGAARQLTYGSWPRWSPDGARIAFKRGNEVFTISSEGSGLAPLGDMGSNDRGEVTWAEDGAELEYVRGVFAVEYVYAVNVRTGEATRSPASLTENGFPGPGSVIELSPGGTQVAFSNPGLAKDEEDIPAPGWYVMDLQSGEVVQVSNEPRTGDIYWAESGLRFAFSGGVSGVFVAERGESEAQQVSTTEHATMAWSPDGKYLALGTRAGLELVDVDGPDDRTLVGGHDPQAEGVQLWMEWMPDGSAVLYAVGRDTADGRSTMETFIVGLDGGPPRLLLRSEGEPPHASPSPNGQVIVFTRTDETGAEVKLIDADGGNERLLQRFEGGTQSLALATASGTGPAVWSPDGTRIAAVLNGTDLYVIDAATGEATFVATNASYCLMAFLGWSPDSETVYVVPQCALGGI